MIKNEMEKMKRTHQFYLFLLTAVFILGLGFGKDDVAQILFRESTFNDFKYPNGTLDKKYTQILKDRSRYTFPKARVLKVVSYVTQDNPRKVVSYYSQLSGQRFEKQGDLLTYIFSKVNKLPASRIEIYPIPNIRIQKPFWPTRVNLYIISYPVSLSLPQGLNRSIEDLRKRAGRFTYNGIMREDVAKLANEELGPDAEVYVLSTTDSFEKVYSFFRRKFRSLYVRAARDGNISVRDFEFDATRAVGLNRKEMELYIRVEENPMVTDAKGNSQIYLGHVFIKYKFWKNH